MKKQVIAGILSMAAMAMVGSTFSPNVVLAQTTPAAVIATEEKQDVLVDVEAKLKASADYLMGNLKNTIFSEEYAISYTDYQDAMFAMKAGAVDKEVIDKLNAVLKDELKTYDNTFLNPYESVGVKSFALAVAVLYLEEIGENPADYQGKNLLDELKNSVLTEEEMNPYVYPYISAVKDIMDDEVEAKIQDDVLSYYVDNETGTGIDYWGVSADNNGQVLTALTNWYETNEAVKEKVDAALAWNATQKDETGAIISWGSANASSTAMALRGAAQFGKMEDAKSYYEALEQFGSTNNAGAYTYMGEDSIFSSRDVLIGLLAYRNQLQGKDLLGVSGNYTKENSGNEETKEEIESMYDTTESDKPQNSQSEKNNKVDLQQNGSNNENEESKEDSNKNEKEDESLISKEKEDSIEDSNQSGKGGSKVGQPKTGDSSQVAKTLAVMIITGAGVVLMKGKEGRYGKEKRN